MWLLSFALVVFITANTAHAANKMFGTSPESSEPNNCKNTTYEASQAECENDVCLLHNAVHFSCDNMHVWADDAVLHMDQDKQFAGLDATGDVVVVENNQIIRCKHLWIGPDRVKTRVDVATIQIKDPFSPKDTQGLPLGRNVFSILGRLDKTNREHMNVYKGSFTMCDCGDKPP